MPSPILRKTLGASRGSTSTSSEDRSYKIALYHANLLQQRKDVEAQILAATETLLDFPPSTDADPALPSQEDVDLAVDLLRHFQPKDYDLFIQERNINRQCGYVLCPRSNRQQGTSAKYRIVRAKRRGADAIKVVETVSLQKWCSDDCGKRALYIKAQLDEEPAWMRLSSTHGDILVLKDTISDPSTFNDGKGLLRGVNDFDTGLGEERLIADMKALAVERSETNAPSLSSTLIEVKENEPHIAQQQTHHERQPVSYNTIEGYHPRLGNETTLSEERADPEDVMSTI